VCSGDEGHGRLHGAANTWQGRAPTRRTHRYVAGGASYDAAAFAWWTLLTLPQQYVLLTLTRSKHVVLEHGPHSNRPRWINRLFAL
jgi:hypothetical protein